jgi:hypothetical protein
MEMGLGLMKWKVLTSGVLILFVYERGKVGIDGISDREDGVIGLFVARDMQDVCLLFFFLID